MDYKNINIEKNGNVALLTISRPEALNALTTNLLHELDSALDSLKKDNEVYVIILTGEGKAFVAGADISEMKDMSPEEARGFALLGSGIFRKMELMDKIVIAAVNGFALGGGCELAISCDIILAGEKAKFGQPEVGLGITPGFGGTQRLSRIVGIKKAKELVVTGGIINAEEAIRIGLVNHVYPQEELIVKAKEMAEEIASKGQIAVRYGKYAINSGSETDIETGNSLEANLFALCFANEDQKEGMSAFLEKRKAKFKN